MNKNNDNYGKKKQQFDLIDFYEVLGIDDKTIPIKEIKKKYLKLAIKYHPDKSKDADPQIFALIQRAWDCLSNEEKRKQYDIFLTNEQKAKKGDHINLKKNFDKFMELNQSEIEDKDKKKQAEIEFTMGFEEMDKKHRFNRKKYEEGALSAKETSNRFTDLMLEREQQEIEFAQSRIFPDGTKFSGKTLQAFNKIFENYKTKTSKNDKLVKHQEGPSAWNCVFEDSNFTTLDLFDKTYDEDSTATGMNYSDLNEFGSEMRLDVDYDKVINMNVSDVEYVLDHNYKGDDYMKNIETKLRERELENENINSKNFNDYSIKEDKSFMFTHEVGNVGNIEWGEDDNEELQEACDRLIELEKIK